MAGIQAASDRVRATVLTYRLGFVIAGLVAIALGVLVLIWPIQVSKISAILIGVYAILMGLVYIVTSVRATGVRAIARVTGVAAGVAFITAGIVVLSFLGSSASILVSVLGAVLGILWIIEGVSALLVLRGSLKENPAAIAYAVFALIVGVVLGLSPIWGGEFLHWMIGIGLILLGIAQVLRAATVTREVEVDIEVTGSK